MATARKSGAKKPAASARAAQNDATALLTRDHDEVKKLFRDYEKLADKEADAGERQSLAEQICTMRTRRSRRRSSIRRRARRTWRATCSTKRRSSTHPRKT